MRNLFFGNEFLYFLLKEIINIEMLLETDLKNNFENSFLITDDNIFKIKNQNFNVFKKVIILTDKIDTKFFQINKENFNIIYLRKDEYLDIVDTLSQEKNTLEIESRVILSDIGNEFYIPLKKITFFSYDRVKKKSFITVEKEKKFLKKTLTELEEILPKTMFERVERGIILNLNLIKEIDYKEEYILMQDNEKIYLGKTILKKIKDVTLKNYKIL